MKEAIHYVGLDVHKETIAVALSDPEGRATSLGTIPNRADAVASLMRKLQQRATLKVCYEAGACGYVLQLQLARMGIDCIVVAPTLIPVKSGDRVKTDRRDALKLARYLRAGELTAVWVPDEAHEALRDLVRLREDAKADQKRAQNRLSKFLLRQGWYAPPGTKAWSLAYRQWLESIYMEQSAQRQVLRDSLAEVDHHKERLARLDAAVSEQAAQLPESMQRVVAALVCLHGVAELTAVTVVAETGDLGDGPEPVEERAGILRLRLERAGDLDAAGDGAGLLSGPTSPELDSLPPRCGLGELQPQESLLSLPCCSSAAISRRVRFRTLLQFAHPGSSSGCGRRVSGCELAAVLSRGV